MSEPRGEDFEQSRPLRPVHSQLEKHQVGPYVSSLITRLAAVGRPRCALGLQAPAKPPNHRHRP